MEQYVIDVENACKSYKMGDEHLQVLNNISQNGNKGKHQIMSSL